MFRPLNKNILLLRTNEEKHNQKIFLGASSNIYEVQSIGKEVVEVKVKDKVYVDESKLHQLIIDGVQCYVIEEQYVYLVVEE